MSEQVEQTKVEFNPQGSYKWEPEDKFELSGQEFAYFFQVLKKQLTEQMEMFKVLESKLIKAVETGVAKEIPLIPQSAPEQA